MNPARIEYKDFQPLLFSFECQLFKECVLFKRRVFLVVSVANHYAKPVFLIGHRRCLLMIPEVVEGEGAGGCFPCLERYST